MDIFDCVWFIVGMINYVFEKYFWVYVLGIVFGMLELMGFCNIILVFYKNGYWMLIFVSDVIILCCGIEKIYEVFSNYLE